MNGIARTLINLTIATGMATAALSLGSVAHAETPGPVIVLPPAEPGPKGPGEIANPTPEPVDPSDGPDDLKAPEPKPQPPKGPQDLSNGDSDPVVDPKPEPAAPQKPADQGCFTGCDLPEAAPDKAGDSTEPAPAVVAPAAEGSTVETAQVGSVEPDAVEVVDTAGEDGSYLTWLLVGLGAAGVAGTVLVAVRRRKATAEA
ncbi:MAG: hypothetical protein NTV23_05790 [Propionibacteriales bacterium]|nr:hypothetical protein [Propionibacteriales bacterium]